MVVLDPKTLVEEAELPITEFGLNDDDFVAAGVAVNGEAGGIGRLASGLKRGFSGDWALVGESVFFSGLPEFVGAGSGFSRMLWKTLEVTLRPLGVAALLF